MGTGEMSFYGSGEQPEYLIICDSCGNRSLVSGKHGRYCPVVYGQIEVIRNLDAKAYRCYNRQ